MGKILGDLAWAVGSRMLGSSMSSGRAGEGKHDACKQRGEGGCHTYERRGKNDVVCMNKGERKSCYVQAKRVRKLRCM